MTSNGKRMIAEIGATCVPCHHNLQAWLLSPIEGTMNKFDAVSLQSFQH
jgi:hypothetical protein